MEKDKIIEQSVDLMNKATETFIEKENKEKSNKTIKEVYVDNIEEIINRVGLGEVTLESEINIPEIYIDKDKETQDLIKKLGFINSKPETYGLIIEFSEDTFTTVVDGEVEIEGKIYKTKGEDMGILKVITTINNNVDLEQIKKLLLNS